MVQGGRMGDGAHWWGEAPERSIDFRKASGLSGSIVNKAGTRAEPLVPGCSRAKLVGQRRLVPLRTTVKGLNMRWAYRGSAHVSSLLVTSQGARSGVAKMTRTVGSLAPPMRLHRVRGQRLLIFDLGFGRLLYFLNQNAQFGLDFYKKC